MLPCENVSFGVNSRQPRVVVSTPEQRVCIYQPADPTNTAESEPPTTQDKRLV